MRAHVERGADVRRILRGIDADARRPACRRPRPGRAGPASARRRPASRARCHAVQRHVAHVRDPSRACIARRRSWRAGARSPAGRSGSTLRPGSRALRALDLRDGRRRLDALDRRWPARAVGGRPISGPRSSMSMHRRPQRAGQPRHLLRAWSKLHVAGDVGEAQLALHVAARPTARRACAARRSARRASVCGSAMPSSGIQLAQVWPLISKLASMPSSVGQAATVPLRLQRVLPAAALISSGNGALPVAVSCSTLPVRPSAVSGWPLVACP